MNFNRHLDLEGRHAFLSASQYSWIRYSEEDLEEKWRKMNAAARGTRLHEFAAEAIKLGERLSESTKTLNSYVNDAIGFRMKPEVMLYYSDNIFGTVDTISYRNNELRVHDLKTGENPAKFDQLVIYVALFCLEYGFLPSYIKYIECRIYQNDEIFPYFPDVDEITHVMSQIKHFDKLINQYKLETFG